MAEEQNRSWVDRYMLRMPDGLRDRVKAAAEANTRSMNAEIVATLEAAYPAPRDPAEELRRLIDSIPPEDRPNIFALLAEIERRLGAS